MFKADSLASLQDLKPVDIDSAKAAVRFNRRVRSGEIAQVRAAKATLRRKKAWWKYRQGWRSVHVDGRVGKLHPQHTGILRAEFPDGSIRWVSRDEI